MKYSFLIVIASLLFFSQTLAVQSSPKARLFDSWGRINSEDASARLDNAAVGLQNEPGVHAQIICYGPEGEGSGTGKSILRVMNDYLVNLRGVDQERVQMAYGGRYKDSAEVHIEFWFVPLGAEPPEPTRFETKPQTRRGKVTEYIGSDYSGFDECGCGPPQGNVTLAALADALNEQSTDVVYIVAFNVAGAAPGTWRRVARIETNAIQSYGIENDRIKIIFGGTVKNENEDDPSSQQARIQLWVLPKDSTPPVEDAKPEQTPKEAVLIGSYNDYLLKYPEQERRIFEGFVDMLRSDAALSVCIIVRPTTRAPNFENPALPDEPADIDAVKLVEKWKTELTEKHGFKTSRVVVIPANPDETNEGTIEVWVLPNGAALPNPYARNGDDNEPDPPPRVR